MPDLDQPARQARNILLVLFIGLCVLDIVLVFLARDAWAIGRILLTVVVMYFVLQGRKWAKWVLMGLCSLVVVALLALIAFRGAALSVVLVWGSGLMVVLSVIIPVYMAVSQDLNRYFVWKRQGEP